MKSQLVSWPALAVLVVSQLGCSSGSNNDAAATSTKAGTEAVCAASSDARIRDMSDERIGSTSALGLAKGRYVLPATDAPTQLVVMFHGSHNETCSWRNHLRQAADHGAVAVAMDYTGQGTRDGIANWGWFVNEGAADSIAAAKYFLAKYPTITQVFAFGVSMGGNASGMAVSSPEAVRADGTTGLFDYWVDVEGVNNLMEEYAIIRPLGESGASAAAAVAQAEIETEAGGAFEDNPDAYRALTNIARVQDMSDRKLKGVIVINGVDDGLVSTSQSPEMATALNAVGIPAHLFTVLLRGDGEAGTTATGSFVLGPDAAGPGKDVYSGATGENYESPLAGHAWEGSDTHIIMRTALDQLWALMGGAEVTPFETVIADDGVATPAP